MRTINIFDRELSERLSGEELHICNSLSKLYIDEEMSEIILNRKVVYTLIAMEKKINSLQDELKLYKEHFGERIGE